MWLFNHNSHFKLKVLKKLQNIISAQKNIIILLLYYALKVDEYAKLARLILYFIIHILLQSAIKITSLIKLVSVDQ